MQKPLRKGHVPAMEINPGVRDSLVVLPMGRGGIETVETQTLDPSTHNQEGSDGVRVVDKTPPWGADAALAPDQACGSDYPHVRPGVVFMDIPGTGDANSKRDEMWKAVTGRLCWVGKMQLGGNHFGISVSPS